MAKPHLILTPTNEICVMDVILWHGELKLIEKMRRGEHETYVLFTDGKFSWLRNGKKYYAHTTLQTYARSPRGRKLLGTPARATWQTPDTPSPQYAPRLDAGKRDGVAPAREGCAASELTDPLQGVQQPRATVCMTRGQHLKENQFVAMRVVKMHATKTLALSLPSGGYLTIDPDRFYDKVN